jgi:hypothetical protein
MKKRLHSAVTANAGVTAVHAYCDHHGLIFQAEPREDYGIDCYIEVEDASYPQNFLVGLQVKSGRSHRYDRRDGTFSVHVAPDDARYWLAANYPVLLVYLHDGEDVLYFRHVQAAFGDEQSLARCTSLVFREADRAGEGLMAEYVRALARATPSILSRFRVLSEPAVLTVESKQTVLGPAPSGEKTLSFDRFRVSDMDALRDLFPMYFRVLGYSADERWVCEVRVPDGGPADHFSAEFAFVDLAANASIKVPILTIEESDMGTMTEIDWAEYDRKVDHLNGLAELLKIRPARVLYDGYHAFEPESRPQIRLSFGEEAFVLGIAAHEGRDTLAMTAVRYQPPRTAHLLIERAPFAFLLAREDDLPRTADELMPMEKSQRFEYVAGVAASQGGTRLTIAVMTVDTRGCWGTRAVHLVHLGIEELRRACADSLRT